MERVQIGSNFSNQTKWKKAIGIPLVYVPIVTTIPFLAVGVFLVKLHLKLIGASNVRSYWDFVPAWVSHRYQLDDQITNPKSRWYNPGSYRAHWIFNCKLYCPLSIALCRYTAYLVMIVENWWCPFHHDQIENYREGAIDKSYWHLQPESREKIHPDDRGNPIWNEESPKNGAGK